MRWLPLLLLFACSGPAEPSDPPRERRASSSMAQREAPPSQAQQAEPESTDTEEPVARPRMEAMDSTALVEPAVGQWVRYGVNWRSGGRSTTRYAIVDREAGGFWVEVEDRRGGTVRQVRMHLRQESNGETEVLALAFKRDGRVQEIPPRLLGGYTPMLQQWLVIIFPPDLGGEPETVEVPAGEFVGAYRSNEPLEFGTERTDATLWRHPAVPLTGLVKLQDESGEHRMELIGFALEGARSTF